VKARASGLWGKILLVADDDGDVRRIVAMAARQKGMRVIEAEDGERALRLCREERPDLIVLDVMMPKQDGRDVCRKVRTDAAIQHIPIIMFTAKEDQADRLAGLALGADDYITKPFKIDMLMRRVEHLIWKRHET
jgi:DNA-binding response OmpR family regulator